MSHFFCAFVFRETHNVDDAPRGRQKPPLVRVARRRDRLLLPGEARAPPDRADDAVEKSLEMFRELRVTVAKMLTEMKWTREEMERTEDD